MLPSRFKRWRKVLHAEIGDPSKRNGTEQNIFFWMKFFKANARRASVEPVLKKTGVRDILFSMIACMAALRGDKGRGLAAYSPS